MALARAPHFTIALLVTLEVSEYRDDLGLLDSVLEVLHNYPKPPFIERWSTHEEEYFVCRKTSLRKLAVHSHVTGWGPASDQA